MRQRRQAASRRRQNGLRDREIIWLAGARISQREIAQIVGVSRGAVEAVMKRHAQH